MKRELYRLQYGERQILYEVARRPRKTLEIAVETRMPLSDTHAVILGGNSGIGMATARSMSERGARVTIVGRSEAKTREAAEDIGARGEVGDGRDETAIRDLFGRIACVSARLT